MDPSTGKIYDINDPTIPDDVRQRLIPVSEEAFVKQEADEMAEILEAFKNIKELPDLPPEKFYPVNRAARRAADKRERKQKFVNKPGKVRDNGQGR